MAKSFVVPVERLPSIEREFRRLAERAATVGVKAPSFRISEEGSFLVEKRSQPSVAGGGVRPRAKFCACRLIAFEERAVAGDLDSTHKRSERRETLRKASSAVGPVASAAVQRAEGQEIHELALSKLEAASQYAKEGKATTHVSARDFLAQVAEMLDRAPYERGNSERATGRRALEALLERLEGSGEGFSLSPKSRAIANKILRDFLEREPADLNDYERNVARTLRADTGVNTRTANLLASVVYLAKKKRESQLVEAKCTFASLKDEDRTYVGGVGQRKTVEVQVTRLKSCKKPGFRSGFSYEFRTWDGNVLRYWSSRALRGPNGTLTLGETIDLRATIKAHQTDKVGAPTTVITRASVMDRQAGDGIGLAD